MTERVDMANGQALPERLPSFDPGALSQDEFYRRFPADAFMHSVAVRRDKDRGSRWLAIGMGGAAAAAAALVVFWLAPPLRTPPSPDSISRGQSRIQFGYAGSTNYKGTVRPNMELGVGKAPHLAVHRWADGTSAPLAEGEVLHVGQVLRFYYDCTGHEFLYLFSVDDAGRISPYYPYGPAYSIPIVQGRNIPLPDGVQLDGYVGHERFFALFSNQPLRFHDIGNAVSSAWMNARRKGQGIAHVGRLAIPCAQASFLIEKR